MNKVFTGSFWLQLFLNTFLTMIAIYVIKQVAGRFSIPVVSTVAEGV